MRRFKVGSIVYSTITNHTMEGVVETGEAEEDDTNNKNTLPSLGVGVVRILSFELKGKVFTITRYLKTMQHSDPRHICLNFPKET